MLKNIVLLYNLQRVKSDPKSRDSLKEADYDREETIDAIYNALKKLSKNVVKIEAISKSIKYFIENQNNIDLVFNYSIGEKGINRYAHFPTLFEMLGISYTGPDPLSQSLISNKNVMKTILLQNGINTAPFKLIDKENNRLAKDIRFPLIIKPVDSGGSAGMIQKSVIHNPDEYKKRKKYFLTVFDRFIIEEFLQGREISVSLLGNPPVILPITELHHELLPSKYEKFSSSEVKNEEIQLPQNYLSCPAKLNSDVKRDIHKIVKSIWKLFSIKDWARIDIRFDYQGKPYVLDINSPSSLEPVKHQKNYCSMTSAAVNAGISYNELIKIIVDSAVKRYKNS